MRKPKPPTARSVSATLRAAGFRRADKHRTDPDGYEVSWLDNGTSIQVDYWVTDDGSTEGRVLADGLRDEALAKMASTLRQKGWPAERHGRAYAYLLVTAKEG